MLVIMVIGTWDRVWEGLGAAAVYHRPSGCGDACLTEVNFVAKAGGSLSASVIIKWLLEDSVEKIWGRPPEQLR